MNYNIKDKTWKELYPFIIIKSHSTKSQPNITNAITCPSQITISNSCQTCQLKDLSDARQHYKSDFHHYNLKRKLAGLLPMDEDTWMEMESITSSIDNSIDSDEEDQDEIGSDISRDYKGSPFVIFDLNIPHSDSNLKYVLEIYKPLLDLQDLANSLHALIHNPFTWTFLMVSSGHFAGAVFDSNGKILVSKTFHRYTTRRKQGGAQSAKDKSGKSANSAGATLRRYNEQALKSEIQELLTSWKEQIKKSSRIFVRAKNENRQILEFDKNILDFARVKSFPFTTGRPTINELKRCFDKLISVEMESIPIHQEKTFETIPKSLDELKSKTLNAEFIKLVDLVKRGKNEEIKLVINKELVQMQVPDAQGTSLLHIASSNGHAETVQLLLEWNANALMRNELKFTPYQVAASKAVRDVYRRFIANGVEWDWKEAGIPSPLTKEMELAQKEKEKEKKKKAKEKAKEKQAQQALELQEQVELNRKSIESVSIKPKNISKTQLESIGMDPQKRAILDREKRAMAAEARQRLSLGLCCGCGKSLKNVSPFDKNGLLYCSMTCLTSQKALHI